MKSLLVTTLFCACMLVLLFIPPGARTQQPPATFAERARAFSNRLESEGLKEPFKGITAKGEVEKGLFSIRSSGVSTEPVRKAAEAFLVALSADQRARTSYAIDDDEWRKWANQHSYIRQGVSFKEMNEDQRGKAFGLLKASLSARGLNLSRDIMHLNETLAELNPQRAEEFGEWLYHITVMGAPSATEPWGWQVDGHHLVVNYFVLGDQVVMTPAFWGSEPIIARAGKYKGTEILREETNLGLAMVNALTDAQKQKAILDPSKTGNNNIGEAFHDNVVLHYAGIRAAELSAPQKKQLLAIVGRFVGNMDDGHARVKMAEVEAHLADTWFAWIGETTPGSVFYYRIHSPVVLIEFDHQTAANLRHLAKDPRAPQPDHIHTVVRTPNGNDYGKDLLRQHYEKHPHPHRH
jgi:hypothetical protein